MQARGKVIVVTGGGSGIGRELVLGLAKRGAKVAAADINEAGLVETRELAGASKGNITTHQLDITDRQAVHSFAEEVVLVHGSVDGLINCAGIIQPFVKVNDLGFDAIERVMNVNFYGTVNMIKTFLPLFLERPEAHIVNISSMGSYAPVPGQTIYGASKAAVKLLTEGLHSELKGSSVKVTLAFPGATKTDISVNSGVMTAAAAEAAKSQSSKFKMSTAEDTAVKILDGMERDAYRVMAGPDAAIMDRLSRISPRKAADVIHKQMASLLQAAES